MGKFTVPRKKSQDALDSGLAVPIIRAMKLSEYTKKAMWIASLANACVQAAKNGCDANGVLQDIENIALELQQVKEIEDD